MSLKTVELRERAGAQASDHCRCSSAAVVRFSAHDALAPRAKAAAFAACSAEPAVPSCMDTSSAATAEREFSSRRKRQRVGDCAAQRRKYRVTWNSTVAARVAAFGEGISVSSCFAR
jgi:hypothetical protein